MESTENISVFVISQLRNQIVKWSRWYWNYDKVVEQCVSANDGHGSLWEAKLFILFLQILMFSCDKKDWKKKKKHVKYSPGMLNPKEFHVFYLRHCCIFLSGFLFSDNRLLTNFQYILFDSEFQLIKRSLKLKIHVKTVDQSH